MPGPIARPDAAKVLSGLRDFQTATVEHVFRRMYGREDPVRRFLVADEVGLGKTLVARGLVAKVVDHLWDAVERIDVVYICSNSSIARQNISRLNITDQDDVALPSRITLLPATISDLQKNKLNFVSFTPGTSFTLRSSLGTAEERALLYWLLPDDWKDPRYAVVTLLAGAAGREGFADRVKAVRQDGINVRLRDSFRKELLRPVREEEPISEQFRALAAALGRRLNLTDDERVKRNALVGELRSALATSCVEELQPDLIILDEFQRFKHLLDGEDPASLLARRLFDHGEARLLLLSATPYKMYTLQDEAGGEDHFADFVTTVKFLQNDNARTESFKTSLGEYRRELIRYRGGEGEALSFTRDQIQGELRRVVVRTERLAVTPDRNGMLADVLPHDMSLKPSDIDHFLAMQRSSRALGAGEVIEYWKSAPYLLNFMEDYELKRSFEEALKSGNQEALWAALNDMPSALLSWEDIARYRAIDPANGRLRSLIADLEANAAWEVAWIPPSCPYYSVTGPFGDRACRLTKRLIFSAWQVVPKVVAAFLSYEAERRLLSGSDEAADNPEAREAREKRRGLLRFSTKDNRAANMPVLALIYPSFALSTLGDPLDVALQAQGSPRAAKPNLESVIRATADRLVGPLERLGSGSPEDAIDDRWYWAAPILLDYASNPESTRRWFRQENLRDLWRPPTRRSTNENDGEESDGGSEAWELHIREAKRLLDGHDLGRQPGDLAEVTAWLAVAAPATAALRALARVTGDLGRTHVAALRNAAGGVADAWLTLFNLPETEALVRLQADGEPYWRRVLEYAAAGNIQALLDEYGHVLVDALGKRGRSLEQIAQAVADEMSAALRTRTANLGVDLISTDAATRTVKLESKRRALRSRFAVRFGARAAGDAVAGERDDVVRRSFNSPFWPFVLCSTSVGQEGLDFHQYCHAVVHWNIPSNPVDLEQREGRVHRYKNHAVRRNVAARHVSGLAQEGHADPWIRLFAAAKSETLESVSDLVPYWVYTAEGGAVIERHVPVHALSTDAARVRQLRKSLAVYRMAFGQSRQEDLVAYLSETLPDDEVLKISERLRIDLSPPRVTLQQKSRKAATTEEPAPERGTTCPGTGAPVALDSGDLEALLDAFSALRILRQPRLTAERVADLLDGFRAARYVGLR